MVRLLPSFWLVGAGLSGASWVGYVSEIDILWGRGEELGLISLLQIAVRLYYFFSDVYNEFAE
jgi:hypothetical protein